MRWFLPRHIRRPRDRISGRQARRYGDLEHGFLMTRLQSHPALRTMLTWPRCKGGLVTPTSQPRGFMTSVDVSRKTAHRSRLNINPNPTLTDPNSIPLSFLGSCGDQVLFRGTQHGGPRSISDQGSPHWNLDGMLHVWQHFVDELDRPLGFWNIRMRRILMQYMRATSCGRPWITARLKFLLRVRLSC